MAPTPKPTGPKTIDLPSLKTFDGRGGLWIDGAHVDELDDVARAAHDLPSRAAAATAKAAAERAAKHARGELDEDATDADDAPAAGSGTPAVAAPPTVET